jgi:F-type H+-transporting ATPase subunit alpha
VPLPVEKQIIIIYAATKGYVDDLETNKLAAFEKGLYDFLESKHKDIFDTVREKKALDKDLEEKLKKALGEYKTAFGKGEK